VRQMRTNDLGVAYGEEKEKKLREKPQTLLKERADHVSVDDTVGL